MSIDLNWETLTTGPDGEELAHRIRDFIHSKFQTVPLPRFIKSVTVHAFEFGSIPPELELKDITDPLPDFYEEDPDVDYADDEEDDDEQEEGEDDDVAVFEDEVGRYGRGRGGYNNDSNNITSRAQKHHQPQYQHQQQHQHQHQQRPGLNPRTMNRGLSSSNMSMNININTRLLRGQTASPAGQDLTSPFLGVSTPGILSAGGQTSSFSYFHSHLAGSGLSGTQTPLAAVAGAAGVHAHPSWLEGGCGGGAGGDYTPGHSRHSSISVADAGGPGLLLASGGVSGRPGSASPVSPQRQQQQQQQQQRGQTLREKHSVSTLAPTSVGTSRPPTRDAGGVLEAEEDGGGAHGTGNAGGDDGGGGGGASSSNGNGNNKNNNGRRFRERRIEDLQAVFRIRYAGDVRLLLTADILLDYPMPSFVGIPVRLSITGLTFDGIGVVAHIRKRVHFCFLSPEDALAAVGNSGGGGGEEEDDGDEEENVPQEKEAGQQASDKKAARAASATTAQSQTGKTRMGGLLQEIRVESEIGQRESGKQSLRNVGKVERFVLEQVRRIFEEEFVYPSFWTFLV